MRSRTIRLLTAAFLAVSARAGATPGAAAGLSPAFRPASPRHAAFLTALDNWKELLPEGSEDPVVLKHAPALAALRSEAATPAAARSLPALEDRFETWKAGFLKDLYAKTHFSFYSDPRRFERYMQDRLAAVRELKRREKTAADPDTFGLYHRLKEQLAGALSWASLDRIYDMLGRRSKDIVIESKPKLGRIPKAKPADVVFAPARRLSPEDLPAPPAPVASDPGYARVRAHLVSRGIKASIVDLVFEEAAKAEVDPLMILAVIKTESYFNPRATSHANARGLMQLIDPTARMMGISNPSVNSYDPVKNFRGGIKFLKRLWARFVESTPFHDLRDVEPWSRDDIKRVIASYNAGPGNAYRWTRIKETADYVPKVLRYYSDFKRVAEA